MRFESRVVLDGSQTTISFSLTKQMFESRVVLDGSQTEPCAAPPGVWFESRVVLDGSQTPGGPGADQCGLRVVLF